MNVIAWLKFELTYYDVSVLHTTHYVPGTTPMGIGLSEGKLKLKPNRSYAASFSW